jgi:hypothetical protein
MPTEATSIAAANSGRTATITRTVRNSTQAHHQIAAVPFGPVLSSCGEDAAKGADAGVLLVGVAFGDLAPGNSWLRRVAGHWWRERGAGAPEIVVATKLVGSDVADPGTVASALEVVRPISGTESPLISAAWDDVPACLPPSRIRL